MIKIDPYINLDAGTMSPFQHGEVYVTDDGTETDLDLGNYARYTNSPLSYENSITTGQIYQRVISQEREGKYLGRCVQVVPHITDEIKRRIYSAHEGEDSQSETSIVIVEIGGTVGDLESVPFLEAVRQIIHEQRGEARETLAIHLTLMVELLNGELKTKPSQHSMRELREIGIQPEILLCRAKEPLNEDVRSKLAMLTNVDYEHVFTSQDVSDTLYEIPLNQHAEKLDMCILGLLGLKSKKKEILGEWRDRVTRYKEATETLTIGIFGKYIALDDAYKSIDEALMHVSMLKGVRLKLEKLDTEGVKGEKLELFLDKIDGLVLSPGFGSRGTEEMIECAKLARERKIPLLGICLGMQIMVIEYARNVLGLEEANSTEFTETPHPVISLLEEQKGVPEYGGSMRLGLRKMKLATGSLIQKSYQADEVSERHRHRYEFSNSYREQFARKGLRQTAFTIDEKLVEAVEYEDHPWAVGVQCHPEYRSHPLRPAPLFVSLVEAILNSDKSGSS